MTSPPPDLFGVWQSSPFRGRPAMLLVHLAIADIVNDAYGYRLWSTVAGLAEKASVSQRTVTATLAELVELKVLEVLVDGGGRGKPTEYRYLGNPATVAPFSEDTLQPFPETLQRSAPRPLTNQREPNGEIRQVFDAWAESTGKSGRTKLDEKRRKLISRALGLYPLDEVLAAVRGWEHSAYHRGENEAVKVYNDLGLLLRDAEHIERFRDLAGVRREVTPEERTTRTRNGRIERFYTGSGWVKEAG